MGQIFFGSLKLWVKNILRKKFLGKKKLGQKGLDPNFFLSRNNQVGLTQGGGYMTAPSQKKVGLKLCWIVVSFAW